MRFEVSPLEIKKSNLPHEIFLTNLIVIIESDALYHANQAKLPDWVVKRFPNPDARVIHEDKPAYYD
jgi:hypothetical protein